MALLAFHPMPPFSGFLVRPPNAMAPKKGDKAKADKAEKTAKAVKANVGKKAAQNAAGWQPC